MDPPAEHNAEVCGGERELCAKGGCVNESMND